VALNFFSPLFLLLLVPVILLLMKYSGRRRYPKEFIPWVPGLRALIFILIILALARPHLVSTYQGLSVVFLVDRSLSTEDAPDPTGWINESLTFRGSEDQAAVLVFGQDNQLIKPYTMERLTGLTSAGINRDHSDLESAMRVAAGLIPGDSNGRIILISDGLETTGDSYNFSRALAASRIPVDVLPLQVKTGEEVAMLEVTVPQNTYPGQHVTVEIEVQSTMNTKAAISLLWGGTLVTKTDVSLTTGKQRFSIPVEVTGQGLTKVQALLEPERDTEERNNAIASLTFVDAPPRVLVVEGSEGKGLSMQDLFLLGNVEAHRISPAQLPASPAALAGFRAVFLVDVPAYVLSEQQLQNLELFVRDLGGGLVAIGGKNSFGLGLYQDTPLERLLPVTMEVESEEELPGLDLVLVIDKSGSMSGDKLNMAKNAAIVSLDILKERDRLGIITFDDSYYIDLPLTEVKDKDSLSAVIEDINIGGGTIIHPALVEAVRLLSASERTKHIVLLSDGMEGAQFNYLPLLEQMVEEGISLSTIALGGDSDLTHMKFLAESVDGRFYSVPNSQDLPAVFLQETILAGGNYLVEEEFTPTVVHPDALSLRLATPKFEGYVASTIKPLAEILLLTHREHPHFARWQYGLGRSVAFTSDTWGLWSENFLQHSGFADLWIDTLSWVTPRGESGDMALDVRIQGSGAEVTALTSQPLEDGDTIRVTITDEAYQQQELELRPVGGNRYSANLPQVNQGIYMLTARRLHVEKTVAHAVTGFSVPYPAEFGISSTEAGADLLESLSGNTGGLVLRTPREVFRSASEPVRRSVEISQWLILVAIILWPMDITIRRFGTLPKIPAVIRKRTHKSAPPGNNSGKDTMEQLLAAKRKKGKEWPK
jgi:secreted protein with Ig-like and vWFA domain